MNNKGFTLVELLAVMVILISISLVTVTSVTSSLTRREEKECKEQQELAISAAKIYFSLSGSSTVTIEQLNGGVAPDYTDYFKEDKKIDRLDINDRITFSNSGYVYVPSEKSCVTIKNNVTNVENSVITYDYNVNENFNSLEYLDTGYIVDWDKSFSIETNVKVTTSGKRYLIIGNYTGSDKNAMNIEINASNQLRFYIGTGSVDKTLGTVTIGEAIKVKFEWNALNDTYMISAKGTTSNISSSGNYSMEGKSTKTLRVGTVDYRSASSPFNPLSVSSLKISTFAAKNTVMSIPSSIKKSNNILGWSTSMASSVATYSVGDSYIVSGNKTLYAVWSGVTPILDAGMIPIIIKDDGTVITVSSTSSEWYNYDQKKWANAVLVKENGSQSRNYYKNNVGVIIPENDILAYYVWIPRYKYKIWTLNKSNKGEEQEIEIVFEKYTSPVTKGSEIGDYITHPAFIWGGSPVAGIWVGKFETGHITTYKNGNQMSCSDINCAEADGLFIKPHMVSIHSNQIGKYFYVSRSMTRGGNPFGLSSSTTDSHITKNTEWGAIAYLANSKYGINGKIRVNNTFGTTLTTGCGAADDTKIDDVTECEFRYGSGVSSYPQSTTGNITGVFDMSGGRAEYVMANYKSMLKTSGLGSFPDSKYYNIIPSDPDVKLSDPYYCTLDTCGGMGLFETHGWYGANGEQLVSYAYPWQYRGGKKSDSTNSSVGIYSYFYTTGTWANYITYRSVLIVQ